MSMGDDFEGLDGYEDDERDYSLCVTGSTLERLKGRSGDLAR
jgi:hypothetical protein